MSRIGKRKFDGEGQSIDGNAIQHQFLYGFENFDVSNGPPQKKARRGQSPRNEEELENPETAKKRKFDGEGQSIDGNAIQHQFLYGFENLDVSNGPPQKKARRGQSQRNEEELEKPETAKKRKFDGEGQSRDGNAVQHQSLYGFENFDVSNGQPQKKARRGQSQRNEDDLEKQETTKAFMCVYPGCPRTFSSKFKLVRHLPIHSGERPFQCTSCGRRFHRKDHLKNHLQVHNPNKILHSCDLCPKTYCSSLSYRKHIALHAAERGDLVCKLCGKTLQDREGIMHHLKIHTNSRSLRGPSERKYPCDRCDRAFFTKKDVKRHLVVHTGKRDFMCQFCPQRFGRKDHLVRHTKKSHVGNSNSNTPSNEAMRKYDSSSSEVMVRKYESPSNEIMSRKFEPPASDMMVRKFESSSSEMMVRKFEAPNGEIMVRKFESPNGEIMVRKFEPPPSPHLPPADNHKNNLVAPQPLPELSGIVISPTTVAPLMDHTVLEPVKPDPTYGVPPNLVQSNYSLSSLSNENGQNLGRFQESSLLPVSQYLPMSNSYPTVTPIMPHPYLNMSTSNNILSDLLPPMSMAPSFTTLSLDATNPPLPHFSQAFQ